jgi:hypothetical protein
MAERFDPMVTPQIPKEARESEFVIYDEKNPRSVINLVWKEFAAKLRARSIGMERYFQMGERQLRRLVKPELNLQLLRMRFWTEYDLAQVHDRKIRRADLLRGICSDEAFENHVRDDGSIAYLLTPPPRYLSRLEVMMNIGLDELADILTLPNEVDGKLDKGLMAIKVKIWELLDEKVRGATVQRLAIHQKIETREISPEPQNLEQIEARLNQVKNQIKSAQSKEFYLPLESSSVIVDAVTIDPVEVIAIGERDDEKNLERSDSDREEKGPDLPGLCGSIDSSEKDRDDWK